MRNKTMLIGVIGVVIGVLLSTAVVLAGSLNPSVGPADPGSQMFTLEQIYQRLTTGNYFAKQSGFTEPASGPGTGTMHTLDEIMAKAPAVDNTNGAAVAQVLTGKSFWGLTAGQWATQTGTMPNNGAVTLVPTTTARTIAAGYHNGSGTVAGDTDLTAANIKNGVNLFGVTGSYTGVTCSGTLNGTRWCDNGNGTVTDMTTGLVWLKKADWGGQYAFWVDTAAGTNAHDRAASLKNGATGAGLSDGSVEGDWRLPTTTELFGLANGTEAVLADSMRAFTGVQSYNYWTSTTNADHPSYAWVVYLGVGYVNDGFKTSSYYVWPVRGGQ